MLPRGLTLSSHPEMHQELIFIASDDHVCLCLRVRVTFSFLALRMFCVSCFRNRLLPFCVSLVLAFRVFVICLALFCFSLLFFVTSVMV